MTKYDAVKLWITERHPNLFIQDDAGHEYILISNKSIPEEWHRRPRPIVEVDFDRKDGQDWFFNENDVYGHLRYKISISDPTYFTKLEETLKAANII